jgi:enediyne biosynthesis thioesterase
MTRSFAYDHTVTFEETNLVGNVYFTHFVRWQGHCRELFLAKHAPGVLDQLGDGLALVTVSCSIDFLDECRALDDITVEMSLRDVRANRIILDFEYHRVLGTDRHLMAVGAQTIASMLRADSGLVPAPIPSELLSALRRYRQSPNGQPLTTSGAPVVGLKPTSLASSST